MMSISPKVIERCALFAIICTCSPLMALPIWFEPNQGQAHPSVQFQSRNTFLRATSAAIHSHGSPIVFTLEDANANAHAEALDRLPGVSNYYLGNDPKKWQTDVPHFARIRYHDVYPDIDLIYYGNKDGQLEYDFVVKPGADPGAIRIAYNRSIVADSSGDLVISRLRQRRPKVYQEGREIKCKYIVRDETHVELALAQYDHSASLTIDPVIDYSTYLGGNAQDVAGDIAVDNSGNMYVTGSLQSPQYPSLNPFQQASETDQLMVIAKIAAAGNALIWYTYVGGTALNDGEKIALDSSGNSYVAGFTSSTDFPTLNAAQPVFGGGSENAVIVKVDGNGKLVYSTYLGGDNQERAQGLAVDSTGAAFVSGFTYSVDFPVTNAIQPTTTGRPDAFLAKLSPAGDHFLFATYLGGSGADYGQRVDLDNNGNPVVVGSTSSTDFPLVHPLQSNLGPLTASPVGGFVTKFSSAGDKLLYSTFLGGDAPYSSLYQVKLDPFNNIWVAGQVTGPGLATKNPIQGSFAGGEWDLVIAELSADGGSLLFSSYFGGSNVEVPAGLASDSSGNIYISGFTYSTDFPVKNSLQPFVSATQGFADDTFLVDISSAGALIYSTLIGGHGDNRNSGVAVDGQGAVYLAGYTSALDFPLKNPLQATYGGGPSDMYIVRLAPEAAPSSPFIANPATVSFRYVTGDPNPPSQTVSVTNSGGAVSFSPSSTTAWLNVMASSTVTPATLTISVNPTGLNPANYTGAIQIDSQTSVQVSLSVLAPAPPVTAISPTSVPVGSATTVITIKGSGFQQGAMVQLNGAALSTTFVDSNTLQIALDQSNLTQPATLSFTVLNPQSAASNAVTFTIGTPPPVFIGTGVVNAASYASGSVAPGEIVTVFGTNFGTPGNTSVTFDGTPATLVYVTATQLAATVPYSVSGEQTTSMVISSNGVPSSPATMNITAAAPGIFSSDASGTGQAAALNQDNTVNGTSNPASIGSVVALYGTGGGTLTTDALPLLKLPVTATVGGLPATVYYAGIAPGLVQGAMQVNVQIPSGVTPGPAVSIAITVGTATSNTVTLAVQ
jgi:uncharacterized protein (TIGR03437 family)